MIKSILLYNIYRTIRVLMDSPSYNEVASDFHLNRAMHQHGYAVTVQSNHLLLMSMDQDRAIQYTYFYALGPRVCIHSQTFSVRDFWRYAQAKTTIGRPMQPPNPPRRLFAQPMQDNVIDFQQLFPADHIDFIRDFDMDNIGKYKIRTARDVHIYRRILTSALQGVLTAEQSEDPQAMATACRFLFLIPPMILRSPPKAVPQRLDAFLAGDLKLCARGLISIQDNYVSREDRAPMSTKHQAAAACVFNGQFSKPLQALLRQETNTTHNDRRAAMLVKHPLRSQEDNEHIQALPKTMPSPPITTKLVYDTLRKSSRRGISPGPNGDRFEFLQSTTYDPYRNAEASALLLALTRFINLEKDGRLPDEWYHYNTAAILVAHGNKMRPLGMGSTGHKLVSATSLASNAKDITKELAPFQFSYAVKNGCEAVVHLLRQMHELNGATHVIITLDVSNAFNSVSRLQGLLSIAQSLSGVYTYASCTYRRNNTLWLESPEEQTREPIQGQEGSTQGAVDGRLFFNTAMNHVLKELNAVLVPGSDGAMMAIADDIVGCVTPQMARQVLDIVVQRFHSLYLKLNYEKCHIFADTPELLRRVDLSGNPNLASIKTTHEGVIVLGAAISKFSDFHTEHIQSVIREAAPALQAITAFSKDHLQQALALLRAKYMSKFAYLTRVTPPHIVSPHLRDIMLGVREALGEALDHELLDNQWGQCLLKPRLGGLGIVDVVSTPTGAYYASILACLPIIAKVDEAQSIGLNCTLFDIVGFPHNNNTFRRLILALHEDMTRAYDEAMEADRDLSLQVLGALPEEPVPTPGAITPPDREDRVNSVNALAAIPMPTIV